MDECNLSCSQSEGGGGMGVRVKLKIKSLKSDSTLELNSLLNTGFESEVPEVIRHYGWHLIILVLSKILYPLQ